MRSRKSKITKPKASKFSTSELLAVITPLFESQHKKLREDLGADLRADLKADIVESARQTRAEMAKDIAPMFAESARQTRAEMVKDIAPMFEEIHDRLNGMGKDIDGIHNRLGVMTKDIHEMKQEIRTAMEVPEAALRHEEAVKDHGERLNKVERDLDVVKTAIKVTNRV